MWQNKEPMKSSGYWTGGFLTVCCALDGRAPLTAGLLAAMRPGAAGGAVLIAELLAVKGYLTVK